MEKKKLITAESGSLMMQKNQSRENEQPVVFLNQSDQPDSALETLCSENIDLTTVKITPDLLKTVLQKKQMLMMQSPEVQLFIKQDKMRMVYFLDTEVAGNCGQLSDSSSDTFNHVPAEDSVDVGEQVSTR